MTHMKSSFSQRQDEKKVDNEALIIKGINAARKLTNAANDAANKVSETIRQAYTADNTANRVSLIKSDIKAADLALTNDNFALISLPDSSVTYDFQAKNNLIADKIVRNKKLATDAIPKIEKLTASLAKESSLSSVLLKFGKIMVDAVQSIANIFYKSHKKNDVVKEDDGFLFNDISNEKNMLPTKTSSNNIIDATAKEKHRSPRRVTFADSVQKDWDEISGTASTLKTDEVEHSSGPRP